MERIRTKFIIAVTQRLAAAADSTAKVELIEELSDNLYSRWQDLTGSGASEEDAYAMALEDLGDVDELLAYLDSLGPEGELPKKEPSMRDFTSELLHGMEGIVRETVSQTKDAVDQAAEIVRNVAEKIKEKYPNGFKGKIYVHVDHDEDAAPEAAPEQIEEQEAQEKKEQGWSFTAGYNRERGGFFCESGQKTASRRVSGTVLPSKEIKAVDVQIVNGDVDIRLGDGPEDDVRLSGDVDHLEVRMSEDGVLSVRQGDTASSSFFFLRGLASADVELTLPRRFWELIQISTVHGDIQFDAGLDAGRLRLSTSSGDASLPDASCTEVSFRSASGDLKCSGNTGSIQVETSSGDISLSGNFGEIRSSSASGDIEVSGGVQRMHGSSASGDVDLHSEILPQELELSSKSGDCGVHLPGGEGFTLQFSTVSGELQTDFELVGPVGARSGEAIYLDGGGRTFHITSISGDLELYQF